MITETIVPQGWKARAFFVCLLVLVSLFATAAADTQDNLGWELISQTGGTTKAMLLDGDTLYVGSGLHVLALDVSDPDEVQILGTSPMIPQYVESIASGGEGRLLVSCGTGGLTILDVGDPANMAVLGTLDTLGYTESAASYGGYAVLADGPQGVQIVDLSDAASPDIVSAAYPLAYVYDVVIQNNVAYAAGGGSGLFVVDLRDPTAPAEAGLFPVDGYQYDAEMIGGRLYLAGSWGGVSVFSLDQPLSPKQIATVDTAGWAMSLTTAGDALLVLDGANGAAFYDISAAEPALLSEFATDGFAVNGAANSSAAFLLDEEKGFFILDCADKANVRAVGRWIPMAESRRVEIANGVCYVAGGMGGFHAYSMDNPYSPKEIAAYDTGTSYAYEVMAHKGILYATVRMTGEYPVLSFDIGDSATMRKIGAVDNTSWQYPMKGGTLAVHGDLLYSGGRSPSVIDVSDPADLRVVYCVEGEETNACDVRGSLFAVRGNQRIQLFDCADPANLRLLSTIEEPSSGSTMRFLSDTLLMTSTNFGVSVYDVTDPQNPTIFSKLDLPADVSDIFLAGDTAYLSARKTGVYVVDISKPKKLRTLGLVKTVSDAWDCFVEDDLMFVADSFAGLTVYRKGGETPTQGTQPASKLILQPVAAATSDLPNHPAPLERPNVSYRYTVTSTADSGPGTLRDALSPQNMQDNTTITFDPAVFTPDQPATIALESPLPPVDRNFITIDASNAGVILDGQSKIEFGLTLYGQHAVVMGLQIHNFTMYGIKADGAYAQIGGNRSVGDGPVGQGNQVGYSNLAIGVNGWKSVVQGNLVGVDVTGTEAQENWAGIFVTGNGDNSMIGGTEPGEGNVVSASTRGNIASWSDGVTILGNLIGLDSTGTKAIAPETPYGVFIELEAVNNTVGGTEPGARNVISGTQTGVIFGDQKTYQASLIGNFIGTDSTGMYAIPNQTAFNSYVSYHNRVGGTAEGEGNVISGNRVGIDVLPETPILGNLIGLAADGLTPLPNDTAFSIRSGVTIGGYTPREGNRIYGGSFAIVPGGPDLSGGTVAGNTFESPTSSAVWLNNAASGLFIQNNTFFATSDLTILVEGGARNTFRGNTFSGSDPKNFITLTEKGNGKIKAPVIDSASKGKIKGTACKYGIVDVYLYADDTVTWIGSAAADKSGAFTFLYTEQLSGQKVLLLVTDPAGNTSAFSAPKKVK